MQRRTALASIGAMAAFCAAARPAFAAPAPAPKNKAMTQKKTLVAYYSRKGQNYVAGSILELAVGNTAQLAQSIARRTRADLYEIRTQKSYPVDYRETTRVAQEELAAKARPALSGALPDLALYDEIYLGYPIWWGRAPRAVLAFVEALAWQGKAVHLFCTHEGSGISGSVPELRAKLAGATVEAELALAGNRIATREAALDRYFARK